jgi:hypothetical protein
MEETFDSFINEEGDSVSWCEQCQRMLVHDHQCIAFWSCQFCPSPTDAKKRFVNWTPQMDGTPRTHCFKCGAAQPIANQPIFVMVGDFREEVRFA